MARAIANVHDDADLHQSQALAVAPANQPLRVNDDRFAFPRDRLRKANRTNPRFAEQRDRLLAAVSEALDGLLAHFASDIESVVATGDWALQGIDPRTLPEAEDLLLDVVVRADHADFGFDERVSTAVLADIQGSYNESVLLPFRLLPLPLWRHAVEHARIIGRDVAVLGVPLLVRM